MIAIVELYQHDEVLRHYCNLLKENDQKVKIFCSSIVYQMLKDFHQQSSFEWIVQTENQSISVFLKSNHPLIQEAKLVFITTALNNFRAFYQLSTINKTILLVHNAHSFLTPQAFLDLNGLDIMDRLRWLKITLNRSHFYKNQLLKNLAGLVFPTEIVLQYVKDNFKLPPHLKLTALSFAAHQQRPPTASQNRVTITIPCTVMSGQRDYTSVLNSIKKIKRELSKNIHLILLGKPKGDGLEIIAAFQQLESLQIKVTSFTDTIPTEIYEGWLRAADFLILPLNKYGRNHIYKEQLGYSKISGGVNDMIRFGIPGLISRHYPLEHELENLVERYNDDELADKILRWVNQKQYLNYKATIKSTLTNYSLQTMQVDFFVKINSLLN